MRIKPAYLTPTVEEIIDLAGKREQFDNHSYSVQALIAEQLWVDYNYECQLQNASVSVENYLAHNMDDIEYAFNWAPNTTIIKV